MSGSFKKIDYRLRPAKHAERVMLIDLFKRFRFAPIETYQYVGFGSVAFIDFRMVHRSLGIEKLVSIEVAQDATEQQRFANNNPYGSLALHFGHSSDILPNLDFTERSIVWLDYDDALSRSMANDLAVVARQAPSGTFIGVTFTTAFPIEAGERQKELARLKGEFPEFLPDDTKANSFDGIRYAKFGRLALGAILEKAVLDADAGKENNNEKRILKQVCFFRYKDGTPMVTVGWVIISNSDQSVFDSCHFSNLPFVRMSDEPLKITIPLVTPFEVREMERKLPNIEASLELNWIPQPERRSFCAIYRYLPQFSVVEQI